MANNRYALITVDTEALPNRAGGDRVKRLMWGEYEAGRAGIREMCSLGEEAGARQVFFVDICGAYDYRDEVSQVISWLKGAGQDVQLHAHPEYLPEGFWGEHGLSQAPAYMNDYDEARAEFIITHFSQLLTAITGEKTRAFRAGSFRWNAGTIRALAKAGIPLSFNNSMSALAQGRCLFSRPANLPYTWSNGVIEVPVTESRLKTGWKRNYWRLLQYPESVFLRYRPGWRSFLPFSVDISAPLLVYLAHSWSLLNWDENGHGVYLNDRRLEGYRTRLKHIAKDYDIITTVELLDLLNKGHMTASHVEDLAQAERPLFAAKKKEKRRP